MFWYFYYCFGPNIVTVSNPSLPVLPLFCPDTPPLFTRHYNHNQGTDKKPVIWLMWHFPQRVRVCRLPHSCVFTFSSLCWWQHRVKMVDAVCGVQKRDLCHVCYLNRVSCLQWSCAVDTLSMTQSQRLFLQRGDKQVGFVCLLFFFFHTFKVKIQFHCSMRKGILAKCD